CLPILYCRLPTTPRPPRSPFFPYTTLFRSNNDTVVPPGAVRRLVEFAERHPEVGMVGPRLRDGSGQFQVSYRQQPTMAALLHKRSEEHTSELQSRVDLVCRLLLEKKK